LNKIWTYIEKQKWQAETKYRIALLIFGTLYALIGFSVWLIIRNWTLSTWDWMICFVGYPVIISLIVVFLYSCNHDFHNGKP